MVREVRDDGARYLGPFSSRQAAESAIAALHEAFPLRQCTKRLSTAGAVRRLRAGRDGPLRRALHGVAERRRTTPPWSPRRRRSSAATPREVVAALHARMGLLAGQERFEDAGAVRDRLLHLVRAAARAQRLAPLAACPEVVAARREADGGWEVVCVRYGRLAGTTISPRGADPMPYIARPAPPAPRSSRPAPGPLPAAHARGDREGPALAGGAGRAARRRRRRVDLPGARRRRRPGPARAPGRRAARRGRLRRARPRRPVARPPPRRSCPAPRRTSWP